MGPPHRRGGPRSVLSSSLMEQPVLSPDCQTRRSLPDEIGRGLFRGPQKKHGAGQVAGFATIDVRLDQAGFTPSSQAAVS